MKRSLPIAIGSAILLMALNVAVRAADLPPGQVDFGTFSPPKEGGEFVEVNIPSSLILLVTRVVEKDEPDLAQVLNGLKLVRVNVIGLDEDNRAEMQRRAQRVRKELATKGWERIVMAQQKDQDISVYLKMADKGAVQGLAAVVLDGKEHAVFANIVGDIKPEQLAMLGDKLHLDPLKKIGHAAEKPEEKSKEKAED
jgi:hypothetical protein